MQWILGRKESPLLLSKDWEKNSSWTAELCRADLCYGGFLWGDTLELSQTMERLHSRLCFDFQAGWSAVGFALRGGGKNLGPWAVPTTARPHARAPIGVYLLSPHRLQASLPTKEESYTNLELCHSVHLKQVGLGPIFCDPNLELELPCGQRDFHYRAPSKLQVFRRAAEFLLAPGAPS